MARLSILLVDDDAELCSLMVEFFAQHDMDIQFANNGERGLNLALNGTFDLILLDVMMPGLDGFSVLRQIRRRSPMPVIMLTARTEHGDRIEGLNQALTITSPNHSARMSCWRAFKPCCGAPAGSPP